MIINDFVRDVLSNDCFGFLTSLNKEMQNEVVQIMGYHYDEPSAILTLFANKEDALNLATCFSHTKKIACVLTESLNYNTIQFKGECTSCREVNKIEYELIETKFLPKAREIFQTFGLPESYIQNWIYNPGMAFEVKCTEVFDQTPKQNTGTKICQA